MVPLLQGWALITPQQPSWLRTLRLLWRIGERLPQQLPRFSLSSGHLRFPFSALAQTSTPRRHYFWRIRKRAFGTLKHTHQQFVTRSCSAGAAKRRYPTSKVRSSGRDSVQFSSISQSCPTLCDPMDCSTPGLPVHHQLPEFTQTHVH